SEPLTHALRELSRREGTTLFMTLLAAFQVLLHRYSGQENIAVGFPIAGRHRAELQDLVGFFVNTLVLRADLSGNPAFPEFLAAASACSTIASCSRVGASLALSSSTFICSNRS